MATSPRAAPVTTPKTAGCARATASTDGTLERALVHLLGGVLLLAAVQLQHVHLRPAESGGGVVHGRVHLGREAVAGAGSDEALSGEVPARRRQLGRNQLLGAPEVEPDVVLVGPVGAPVLLVVGGLEVRIDVLPVDAGEGREEVRLGG